MKTLAILALIGTFVIADTLKLVYPDGELGKMIKLGEDIIKHTNTHPLTKDLVDNELKCVNSL